MLLFDLRDALRDLTRDRLYSSVIILTLALTIGATTAVFSIVNGVLLKPLAYRESHQLVAVSEVFRELASQYPMLPANPRHFDRWRDKASTFVSMAEYRDAPTNLTGLGEAAQIMGVRTSGTLFDVLQIQPALGRLLTRADEALDQPRVAVVSHAMWRERMHADDAAVIGRSIVLDGIQHTVVGVLPADVKIPRPGQLTGPGDLTAKVEVFVPLRLNLQDFSPIGEFNYTVIGRLRSGIMISRAQAELDVLQADLAREAEQATHQAVGLRSLVSPLADSIVGAARRGLLLLLAAIATVLLVACSNLANLSLTRTLTRLRDAAIRTALGATRGRLIARVIFEQMILAALGGALGLGIALAALRLFVTTAPIDLPRVNDVAIDGRVIAFAVLVSVVAGLAVALVPAWRIAGRDVQDVLRGGGTTTDRGGLRVRSALLTLQVALSVALLAVTALLTVSFTKLLRSDRGFSTDGVVAIDVSLPASRYAEPGKLTAAYDRLLEQVQAIPGVASAAWVSALPLTGENWVDVISIEGDTRPFAEMPTANYRFVAPDYFKTMGIPLTRGRSFTADERGDNSATLPAIITARTAATVWPGRDAIGRRFLRGDPKQKPFEVVGIISDGHTTRIDVVSPLMVYVPYWFRSRVTTSLVVHTTVGLGAMASDIRRVVREVDPDIAVASVRPLQQLVDDALASRRYQVTIFVVFGAVALLIAMIGVYAVTAYTVSRRRREMNIRVALGASSRQVLGLVMGQATAPLAIGIALGAVAAVAIGTVAASLLFEMNVRDPRMISGVAALVGTVGIASAFAAARQGLVIDPAAALRQE